MSSSTVDFSRQAVPGIRALSPYQPGKPIEELERELGISNIAKLASNENPLGPSPAAVEAARAAAADAWLYPDGNGFNLKQKLASLHKVDVSQITLGNGSSDVLEFAVRVFANPGDEVLFSDHSFAMYPIVTQAVGAVGVSAPATAWGYDLEAVYAHITDKTKVIFIANPNNPTGTWVGRDALETFIQKVPQQILVVLDEAYFDYASHLAADQGYPVDTIDWISRYPNLMVARTFSKSYGLAGMRIGYSISTAEVADLLNRVRPPFNVNSLALAAAEAALGDAGHLQRSIELNAAGLKQMEEGFQRMGLDYIPSIGNFISVDVRQEGAALFQALLHEGVIVRPVANYGMPQFLRVSTGLPEQNERFLNALGKVLS